MPPYDPKANRPKLVPVDDGPAPVDAILGDDAAPAEMSAPQPAAEARPRLSVVESAVEPVSPTVPPALAAVPSEPAGSGRDQRVLVVAAALAALTVIAVVVARRRG